MGARGLHSRVSRTARIYRMYVHACGIRAHMCEYGCFPR